MTIQAMVIICYFITNELINLNTLKLNKKQLVHSTLLCRYTYILMASSHLSSHSANEQTCELKLFFSFFLCTIRTYYLNYMNFLKNPSLPDRGNCFTLYMRLRLAFQKMHSKDWNIPISIFSGTSGNTKKLLKIRNQFGNYFLLQIAIGLLIYVYFTKYIKFKFSYYLLLIVNKYVFD